MEKRSEIITLRVCPELLTKVQHKLNEENAETYARAKNKHYATKLSIADLLEQTLLNYISEDCTDV